MILVSINISHICAELEFRNLSNLSFQYPSTYLLLCLIMGVVFAFALYFRDNKFADHRPLLKYVLAFLRFSAISGLCVLLLVPMLKSVFEETKNPIIIIASDQSDSVFPDDASNSDQIAEAISQLSTQLSADFEVEQFYFSDNLYTEFPDSINKKSTNLEKVFTGLDERYINQNVGAVILATDGIYNEGKNPLYLNSNISAPLYSIALGDTSKRKDLILSRALNNKIVFLGDRFSVQLDISAQNYAGNAVNLSISQIDENGRSTRLDSKTIRINENDFFSTQEFVLDANKAGVVRYMAQLGRLPGEVTTQNNRKDIFIEVLDARQKILILANAPHPDVSAFKQIIESNKNYELTFGYPSDSELLKQNYDLVLFHNLPSNVNDLSGILSHPNIKNAARLFVLGSQTNQGKFNQIQDVINLEGNSSSLNEIQAIVNNNFQLFGISDELKAEINHYPPMLSPFGNYKISPEAVSLLSQKIGSVETEYPLWVFRDQGGIKTGVIAAEGLWKWRLFNYLQKKNYDEVTELVNKSLQYLTLKEDKRKFRVSPAQNIFKENERIIITAELYNDSYEKINEPEVNIVITNTDRQDFNFTFSQRNDYYYLDAGAFPAGNYRFKASVDYNAKKVNQSGQFSVENIQLEAYDLTARHGMLRNLSEKFGGQLVYPQEISSIALLIKENNQIKPVLYASTKTTKLMDKKWIFYLLFGFLVLEWFFRRYFGSY